MIYYLKWFFGIWYWRFHNTESNLEDIYFEIMRITNGELLIDKDDLNNTACLQTRSILWNNKTQAIKLDLYSAIHCKIFRMCWWLVRKYFPRSKNVCPAGDNSLVVAILIEVGLIITPNAFCISNVIENAHTRLTLNSEVFNRVAKSYIYINFENQFFSRIR